MVFQGFMMRRREELPADNTVATTFVKLLVNHTINDISYEDFNRIVRRLTRMSQRDRDVPERVAEVLADEIGATKALSYIDKALAMGQIKLADYDRMRAVLVFHQPREEVTPPVIRQMAAEIARNRQQLREGFRQLTGEAQQTLRRSAEAVDKDTKRILRSWGVRGQ